MNRVVQEGMFHVEHQKRNGNSKNRVVKKRKMQKSEASKTKLLLVKEEKASLRSDPSALAMPYGPRFRRDKLRAASICGAVLSRQVGMPEAPIR